MLILMGIALGALVIVGLVAEIRAVQEALEVVNSLDEPW